MKKVLQKSRYKYQTKLFICILFLSFIFLPKVSLASTDIFEDITTDTVWNKQGNPYIVLSEITVDSGTTLTIEPGVVVKFLEDEAINVFGTIIGEGTEQDKIYFTSFENDAVLGDTNEDQDESIPFPSWSLNILNEGKSIFSHTNFSYSEGISLVNFNTGYFSDIEMIESLNGFYVNNGTLTIKRSNFLNMYDSVVAGFSSVVKMHDSFVENTFGDNGVFLLFDRSNGEMIDTQIKNTGFDTPIIIFESDLLVEDSVLEEGLDAGILVFGRINPLSIGNLILKNSQVKNFALSGISSFNNTHLDIQNSLISGNEIGIELFDSSSPNFATAEVRESSIIDNIYGGVVRYGQVGYVPNMTSNWWGDISGPLHLNNNPEGLGQEIVGDVQFIPWLTEDPFVTEPTLPECCSSVAFIPGFQASRLYKQGLFFENKLWEPNRNGDAEKLFLNEDGVSIESGIYTKDIIDKASVLGLGPNIYKTFIEFMDDLVSDNTIAEWKAMPYDWRFKISDIIENPIQLENGTYKIVDEVISLAERSDTGKVSLIGHSNGGLVAKEIVRELEGRGKAHLVDKLILVAVPQLGTPKAIGGLLHGDEQELGFFGWPLSTRVARQLGENMFSAHTLLPSEKYFEKVSDPVIVFDPSVSNVNPVLLNYGNSISTFQGLRNFLLGTKGDRTDPVSSDTKTPNILKIPFIDYGKNIHADLDNWTPPVDLEIIEIAGWGLDTIKGIQYYADDICLHNISVTLCAIESIYVFDRRPLFTTDGDGTVVTPSAINSLDNKYYLNFVSVNTLDVLDRDHASILEVNSVRSLINNIIEGKNDLPDFISEGQPPGDDAGKRIRLSVHSPVSLDVYDSLGNHTGVVPNSNTDLINIEENIPNSYYMEFGEGKYVGFENTDQNTKVNLKGTDYGTFTVEIEKVEGDNVVDKIVFADLLVTPLMSGEIIVDKISDPILKIDVDGDGDFDFNISSQENFNPILYFEMIKQIIPTLGLRSNIEKNLFQKANRIIDIIKKDKTKKVEEKIKNYIKYVGYNNSKKISENNKNMIIRILDGLLSILKK